MSTISPVSLNSESPSDLRLAANALAAIRIFSFRFVLLAMAVSHNIPPVKESLTPGSDQCCFETKPVSQAHRYTTTLLTLLDALLELTRCISEQLDLTAFASFTSRTVGFNCIRLFHFANSWI